MYDETLFSAFKLGKYSLIYENIQQDSIFPILFDFHTIDK